MRPSAAESSSSAAVLLLADELSEREARRRACILSAFHAVETVCVHALCAKVVTVNVNREIAKKFGKHARSRIAKVQCALSAMHMYMCMHM